MQTHKDEAVLRRFLVRVLRHCSICHVIETEIPLMKITRNSMEMNSMEVVMDSGQMFQEMKASTIMVIAKAARRKRFNHQETYGTYHVSNFGVSFAPCLWLQRKCLQGLAGLRQENT